MTSPLLNALNEADEHPSSGFSDSYSPVTCAREEPDQTSNLVVEIVDDSSNSSSPIKSSPVKNLNKAQSFPSIFDCQGYQRLQTPEQLPVELESTNSLQGSESSTPTSSVGRGVNTKRSRGKSSNRGSSRGRGAGNPRGRGTSNPRGRGSPHGLGRGRSSIHVRGKSVARAGMRAISSGGRIRITQKRLNSNGTVTVEDSPTTTFKGRQWQYTTPIPKCSNHVNSNASGVSPSSSNCDSNLSVSSEGEVKSESSVSSSDTGELTDSPVFGGSALTGFTSEESIIHQSGGEFSLSAPSRQSLAALEKCFQGVTSKYMTATNPNVKMRNTPQCAAVMKEAVVEADSTIDILPSEEEPSKRPTATSNNDIASREEDDVALISGDEMKEASKGSSNVTMALCPGCGIWSGSLVVCDRCKKDFKRYPPKKFKGRTLLEGEQICNKCSSGFKVKSADGSECSSSNLGIGTCSHCIIAAKQASKQTDSVVSNTHSTAIACKLFYVNKLQDFQNGIKNNTPSASVKRLSLSSGLPNKRKKGRTKKQEPECISLLDSDDEEENVSTNNKQMESTDSTDNATECKISRKHKMKNETGQETSSKVTVGVTISDEALANQASRILASPPVIVSNQATARNISMQPSKAKGQLQGPDWDETSETLTIDLVLLVFGSKRFITNPPRASISPDGVKFHFQASEHSCVALQLRNCDIEKFDYCLSRSFCTFFIQSTPAFALNVRSRMKMKKGEDYFDPYSKELHEKWLFFRPHDSSITSVEASLMKRLIHSMSLRMSKPDEVKEIKQQEASEYLRKYTSPDVLRNCSVNSSIKVQEVKQMETTVNSSSSSVLAVCQSPNFVPSTVTTTTATVAKAISIDPLLKPSPSVKLSSTTATVGIVTDGKNKTFIIMPATTQPAKKLKTDPAVKLITYPPPPAVGGITVSGEDMECLQQGEFLNDVIIEFYLKYLLEEKLTPRDRERTHVFSSFFYKRLTQREYGSQSGNDLKLTPAEKRHLKVRKWTRRVDLFKKDFIIIPINESSHWYVVIICFPSRVSGNSSSSAPASEQKEKSEEPPDTNSEIAKSEDSHKHKNGEISEESETRTNGAKDKQGNSDTNQCHTTPLESEQMPSEQEKGVSSSAIQQTEDTSKTNEDVEYKLFHSEKHEVPCILVMDSLKSNQKTPVVKKLREYLEIEWRTRKNSTCRFTGQNMKGACLDVPQQSNFSDCGVFVLQYVEQFFKVSLRN
ncbi:uncharacterized protein [Apostichopus japonicus]|uniref:uncharacterized protein isoform X3 n=1 Tax=Stichopus japonicus TaxID=307972 RepID=UPI003AB819BA